MNKSLLVLWAIVFTAWACSSPKSETAVDTTSVATDTVALEASTETSEESESDSESESFDSPMDDPTDTGGLNEDGDYVITNDPSYITSPFAFELDSASITEILGDGVKWEVNNIEAGEDEDGVAYEGYSFYRMEYGETSMSFYSYPGKHYANIVTPLLPLRYEIIIGMTKAGFLEAMGLTEEEAVNANVFRMTDDYGGLAFAFSEGKLTRFSVNYEEGD